MVDTDSELPKCSDSDREQIADLIGNLQIEAATAELASDTNSSTSGPASPGSEGPASEPEPRRISPAEVLVVVRYSN